jgi:hypothetical protein
MYPEDGPKCVVKNFPYIYKKKPLVVIDGFSLHLSCYNHNFMNRFKDVYYIWDYFDSGLWIWSRVRKKNLTSFRELDVFLPLGGKVRIGGKCTFDYRWKSYIHSLLSLKCTEEIENSFVCWTPVSCFLPILCLRTETVVSVFIFMLPCIGTDFRLIAESGWNKLVPSWLCLEAVVKTCIKLTGVDCTVENFWWWAKNLPETYRVFDRINLDN